MSSDIESPPRSQPVNMFFWCRLISDARKLRFVFLPLTYTGEDFSVKKTYILSFWTTKWDNIREESSNLSWQAEKRVGVRINMFFFCHVAKIVLFVGNHWNHSSTSSLQNTFVMLDMSVGSSFSVNFNVTVQKVIPTTWHPNSSICTVSGCRLSYLCLHTANQDYFSCSEFSISFYTPQKHRCSELISR